MANTLGSTSQIVQRSSDDGPRIPLGNWFDQAVDWVDLNLKSVFDVIDWPFDQAHELVTNDGGSTIRMPRLAVIAVLALIAYLGGGLRRTLYVVGSLGTLALMGNFIWSSAALTLYHVAVVLVVVTFFTTLTLALAGSRPHAHGRRTFLGWSWIHPYAVVVPGIYFFGIGVNSSLIMTTFLVTPVAIAAALAHESTTIDRIRHGVRAAVQPAVLLLGIYAIVGIGGLGAPLFRSISNQDPALAFEASLGLWLVGFVLWSLLGPWSFDHLPGRASPADEVETPAPEPEPAVLEPA